MAVTQQSRREHPLVRRAIKLHVVQKRKELSQLLKLVEKHKLETVLEIGTLLGGTLFCWTHLAEPDAVVISIDLPGGSFSIDSQEDFTETGLRVFPREGQRLHLLRADSHEASTFETVKTLLGERQLDFLFIDGDHTYTGARQDYEMYSPLVRQGGLIAFHDILPHPTQPDCEVDRLWREVKGDHAETAEFVVPPLDWGGIGVVRR